MSSSGPGNRLARESSPYLRLHAGNPVDWFPWGTEAIAKARAEDKPIFLSVGYSTCYWCHVMERESFSDPAIAEAMNRHFVNVKVDREERPDLDEIYMLATQMLTGQGGWPNSLFLTPKLEPFFAGTYFPPRDLQERPGFPTVLDSMVHAWSERRSEVEEQAAEVRSAIARHLDEVEPPTGPLPGGELAERALAGLRKRFDGTWGGFGEAPKFPTPSNLWLLAEAWERGAGDPRFAGQRSAAGMMLGATLDAMARGGIRDQLGGGFHRYATDREWKVPHFEKMLYDNGLLLEAMAREHARTGSAEARIAALETAAWIGREMTSPEGAFWSALDAETGGHEGAFYVWRRAELEAVLGAEDATFAAPLLGFDGEPFFEKNAYVLHLPRPLAVAARERRTDEAVLRAELDPLRAKLLEARGRRERPATDDKVLADWNGIAIAGLAEAGRLLGEPDLVERAATAADFVLGSLRAADGTLLHAWHAGGGKIAAFLSDYAFLVRGLLRLHAATGERRWLDEAARLADEQAARLGSPRGGFWNVAEADDLLVRGKEVFDGALPAANAVAALDLIELHERTGEPAFRDRAEATLRAFAPIVGTHPDGARAMTVALTRFESLAGRGDGETGARREPPAAEAEPLAIGTPRVDLDPAGSDGFRPFRLRFRVRDGWHLPVDEGMPALRGSGAELERVEWPTARPLVGEGPTGTLPAFSGEVEVRGRARIDAPRAALVLRFVACGEGSCRPPAEVSIGLDP